MMKLLAQAKATGAVQRVDSNTINFSESVQNPFSAITQANFNVPNITATVIEGILIATAIGSFIFLLLGAAQWVFSGGDKDGVEKARKKITNAIIGLLIALSVFAVLSLVRIIFKVDLLGNIDIPKL